MASFMDKAPSAHLLTHIKVNLETVNIMGKESTHGALATITRADMSLVKKVDLECIKIWTDHVSKATGYTGSVTGRE